MLNGFLYACIVGFTILAIVIAARGFTGPRAWFALLMAIGSPSYLLSYPMALAGVSTHVWLLDHSMLTDYLTIVLTSIVVSWIACEFGIRFMRLPKMLRHAPYIAIREDVTLLLMYVATIAGALLSIVLTFIGFHGYFIEDIFVTEIPAWLDLTRNVITMLGGLLFLIYLAEFRMRGRISGWGWLATLLWSFTGILSAMKTFALMPFILIIVAAWITSQLRLRHGAILVVAIWAAYSIVEPMREAKNNGYVDNAFDALQYVISAPDAEVADPGDVVAAFLNRMDYSKEAIRALEADDRELLDTYLERVDETYRLIPLLAFVPRAIWPDKPIANLGGELSFALDNNAGNSITTSGPTASYLWGGYLGLFFNTVLGALFTVLGGMLMARHSGQPLAYVPIIFLALVLSLKDGIMAYYYINLLRIVVVLALFYFAGLLLGFCRQASSPSRDAGGPAKPSLIYAKRWRRAEHG